MKNLSFTFVAVFMFMSGLAKAEPVSIAKVGELAFHRTERLIDIGRIEDTFRTHFKSLDVVQKATTPVTFEAVVSQYPGADGSINTLKLQMNEEGRTTAHEVQMFAPSQGAPTWALRDSVTLAEVGMHYVLDNWSVKGWQSAAEILPFQNALSRFVLTQVIVDGRALAKAEVLSTGSNQILEILITPEFQNEQDAYVQARLVNQ